MYVVILITHSLFILAGVEDILLLRLQSIHFHHKVKHFDDYKAASQFYEAYRIPQCAQLGVVVRSLVEFPAKSKRNWGQTCAHV